MYEDDDIPARVVLQIGNIWTRLGFADEEEPRQLIKLGLKDFEPLQNQSNETRLSRAKWRSRIDPFLNEVVRGLGEASLEGSEVVLIENPTHPIDLRAAIFDSLFEDHRVGAIAIVPELVCPLYWQGLSSGLILDIGYESIKVLPVAHGVPLFFAYRDSRNLGLKTIKEALSKELKVQTDLKIDPELMVAKFCYCRVDREPASFYSSQDATIPGVTISAEARWQSVETLFAPASYTETKQVILTPPELMIECLEAVEAINRPVVLQNIILTGGPANIPGLRERIAMEFSTLLQSNERLKYIWGKYPIRFNELPGRQQAVAMASYKGGVIHAAYFKDLKRLRRADWSRNVEVDWSDMWMLRVARSQRDELSGGLGKKAPEGAFGKKYHHSESLAAFLGHAPHITDTAAGWGVAM